MHPWVSEWGAEIQISELQSPRAVAFVENVTRYSGHLVEWRTARRRDDGIEIVVFDLVTDVPQRPHVPIMKREPVGALFGKEDSQPIVLALREDFPDTEHQQLVPDGVPCSLCVDDRPWVEARATWTPAELFERITLWFHRAARGELHDPNQPLDPFFGGSEYNFVFPRSALDQASSAELAAFTHEADRSTYLMVPVADVPAPNPKKVAFTTVAYRVAPERMTRLRNAPTSFGSLVRALSPRGIDPVADLRARMKSWSGVDRAAGEKLKAALAIVVEFPVMTPQGSPTGAVDTRAFVPSCKLGDLGVALGALFPAGKDQASQSGYAPALTQPPADQLHLDGIGLEVATVHIEFDQERAVELAGLSHVDRRKAVLVGAGAIGSEVSTILAREGRLAWTIVDDDKLLPHNLARHTLSYPQIAHPKATALAAQLNDLRPPGAKPHATALLCNVLTPDAHAAELERALKEAAVIIDASASIAAARFLSDYDSKARRISTFFNPAGEAVVVLAEPDDRSLSLRDLEAQYYRAVLRRPELARHLSATGERFAYTGACRALTNRIPQSRAALLSSLSAAAIGHAFGVPGSVSGVWTLSGDGAVTVTRCDAAPVRKHDMHSWVVTFDAQLTEEIHALRLQGLPAETGGILLGVVDAFSHTIHVVEAFPAPPDSAGDEGGFERGLAGLEEAIRAAMARTMDQVRYVGEWHSHPREYSTSPSYIDLRQMAWLASTLALENRPAVMLIAGDRDINVLAGEIMR